MIKIALTALIALALWLAWHPAYHGTIGLAHGAAAVQGRRFPLTSGSPLVPAEWRFAWAETASFTAPTWGGCAARSGAASGRADLAWGGGNGGQFGQLAARLVQAGFVVVLPNHPGSTSGPARAAEAMWIWERPQDISAVLDALPGFAMVDTARIGTLGFSAGGYSVLALAGARVDPAWLASFCDQGGRGMSECAFFA